MINGILIVQKEQGYTSHDVVAKLRGILKQKKIGHTGTLDPNATGVLPVCLGNATKLCDLMTDHDKEYIAELELGIRTDTQDIWGKVIEQNQENWKGLSASYVEEVIHSFRGNYMQLTPMYSARKVNGKRLYELARVGIEVEREKKPVTFYEIEILNMEFPKIQVRVVCSGGTYIRTLCADIGDKLQTGAVMTSLERTRVGGFKKENSYRLEQLEKFRDESMLDSIIYKVDQCFQNLPQFVVNEQAQKYLENGNELKISQFEQNPDGHRRIRVYGSNGHFYGVYETKPGQKSFRPWKLFLPE